MENVWGKKHGFQVKLQVWNLWFEIIERANYFLQTFLPSGYVLSCFYWYGIHFHTIKDQKIFFVGLIY